MFEAFESSHHFMTGFAAWTGLLLATLATAVPVLQALAAAAAYLSRALRRALAVTRRPAARVALSRHPLRPDLPRGLVTLAAHTRVLLAALEPALAGAHLWRDGVAPRWLGDPADREYAPTIGVTGEVWAWLQSAESLGDDCASEPTLEPAIARVRAALFSGVPLTRRLEAVAEALVSFDLGLRERAPLRYRGAALAEPPRLRHVHEPDGEVRGELRGELGEHLEDDDAEDPRALRERRFNTVLARHDASLRAVARRYARGSACDDLHQEIRLGVWRALPAFRGEASLKTYALRIARYCGARFVRRQPRHEPELELVDAGPSAEETLDARRREAALTRAFAALPETQREALRLKLAGCSYREIATRLNISETNVSVRITRARKSLRPRPA